MYVHVRMYVCMYVCMYVGTEGRVGVGIRPTLEDFVPPPFPALELEIPQKIVLE